MSHFSTIFLISGPSAAGEDSIFRGLETMFPIEKVVTTTTRSPRPGESQGKPYYFISKEKFFEGVGEGKFYEYAEEDGGNMYGVTREEVERALNTDKVVIWRADYQGVITIKQLIPEAVAILIDAPPEQLEARIRRRDKATDEFVRGRMEHAKGWWQNRDKFDYEVRNEDGHLAEAIQAVADIIRQKAGDEKLS